MTYNYLHTSFKIDDQRLIMKYQSVNRNSICLVLCILNATAAVLAVRLTLVWLCPGSSAHNNNRWSTYRKSWRYFCCKALQSRKSTRFR